MDTNNTDPVRALAGCFRNKAADERAKASNREYAEWVRDQHHGAAGAYMDCARMADEVASVPPSAPVGVADAWQEGCRRGVEPARANPYLAQRLQFGPNPHAFPLGTKFYAAPQQPAAVDEAMVERALAAYLRRQEDGESLYGCVTSAVTAALAAQQQG